MLVLLAMLTSSKIEVISLSHFSDLRLYLRYSLYLFDVPVCIVLSKFSIQTQITRSAFLYTQLPFLPKHAAKKPNSRYLSHERGKGCSSSPWCVRANMNDSPAGVGVLWQRGCNPSLTPGDGFERTDLCRSPGHFTNKQGSFHPHLCKLSMLTL